MEVPAMNLQSRRSPIVVWELTRACRLSCIHCTVGALPHRSPVELSTYEAYKTIDQIVALTSQEVILTGGDPLERADIYQLIDYARRRGLALSLAISATPILTGAAVGKLKRNGLERLIVSIDSSEPDRHDAVRGLTGQFAATLLAIRWAKTVALTVDVNTLLTSRNLDDLDSIASLLTALGVARWNVYFPVPVANAKHLEMLTAFEVERVIARLEDMKARLPYPVRLFEAPQYRFFDREDVVFISHTGEVTISPFLPLTVGNVRYQPLTFVCERGDMFAALCDPANLKGKCARCEYRWTCGGSRARAYAVTGDVFAADPMCSYQPAAYAAAVPLAGLGGSA